MNALTKHIAEMLNIQIEVAIKVQEILESPGNIDLSEASQRTIDRAIKEAYADYKEYGV